MPSRPKKISSHAQKIEFVKNYDLLIKNALVADGTSDALFRSDIAVLNDKIVLVADGIGREGAKETIDADGLLLCPGFIDAHSHSDISSIASAANLAKISQGFTTEVTGNCGLSPFPITPRNREHLESLYQPYKVKLAWDDFKSYASLVSSFPPLGNLAPLCGYNTLRASVSGYEKKRLDSSDISQMIRNLDQAMEEGAAGLSGGFIYSPGVHADKEELSKIFSAFARHGKIFTVHLRSEGARLIESISETFEMALDSSMEKVHISHLKTSGRENWGKIGELFDVISKYSQMGLCISADRYPFVESMTNLSAFLPRPYCMTDDLTLMRRMAKESERKSLVAAVDGEGSELWKLRRLVWSSAGRYAKYFSKTFDKISRGTGISVGEICAELLKEDAPGTLVSSKGMSLANMRRIIESEFTFCGCDESDRPLDFSLGRSHPRGFASAPLFFNHVSKKLGIPRTIRKMCSKPAEAFGIEKRGRIAKGFYADILLISPENFKSDASFSNPHKTCSGIEKVWVNGKIAYSGINGRMPERNGRVLIHH